MDKVELRKFKREDLQRIYELFRNDNILKNLLIEKKAKDIRLKDEKEWLEKVLRQYKQKKPQGYHLAIKVNEELIGSIGAHKVDYKNENAEFGYWIGENYWGKGYVTQAIKQFSNILFNKFKFKRIYAFPFGYNESSQKVLEKAGFKFEGEREKAIKKGGKFLDDKLYAKVR